VLGSASAPPSGLRSSRTQHPQHQRPKGGPKQTAEVGQAKLPNSEVVETGLDDGQIEWNGNSDFLFSAVGAEMRCMLCNDADLHLASVDRALLQELACLLSTLGVTIYDEGVPI
jgi:hypothetical protein